SEESLDWLSLDPPATPEATRAPADVPPPDWLSLDPPATPAEPEPTRAPADVPPPDWLNLDPPAAPAAPEPPRAPADVPPPDWLSLDPPATPAEPEPPRERSEESLPDWLSLDAQPIRDEPRASERTNQAEPIRDEAPSNTSEWLSLDAMTAQGSSGSEWLSLPPSSSDQAADSAQATPEDSAWPSIDERIARVQQLRAVAPSPETLSDADAPVPEATTPEPVAKAPPKNQTFGGPLAPKLIDDPCPFCGTQTYVSDRTCRQCQKELVLRKQPRAKRSLALNSLLGLYGINGLFALGISLFGGLALLGIPGNGGEASGAMLSPASLIGLILVTGISLVIMAGLWQQRPWAYIAHGIGLLFSIITVMVAIFAPTLSGIAILVPLLGMMITTLAGGIGALVLLVLSIVLSVLSMDDFFTRMVRITSTGLTMPGEGYQRGLEYRRRGMWHLAAQTWEEAIVEEPRDITIRRALGFVYAKMQRYDDARECLRVALAIEPDDAQLREDLAVIERLRVLAQQR
ncbi:MAG: tetratricopeptide repeat protein, partial [Chloroflexia bacterium]|nr:tetratricopeptide repeat protein [Chloroflexia bacterium]